MGCGAISNQNQSEKQKLLFKKTKSLFQGQNTAIWECQDQSNKKFWMKIYKNITINEQNIKSFQSFKAEIERLKELTKLKLKDTNQSAGKYLLKYETVIKDENKNLVVVMECSKLKTIQHYFKGKLPGVFSEDTIAIYCEQIMNIIKFLREEGSIFCNIKSSNIFLSEDAKHIQLTDFYNIREYFVVQNQQLDENVVYLAPENVASYQYFQETDVWRLGCFFIEVLSCIKPWYIETVDPQQIFQRIENGSSPTFPEKMTTYCRQFLQLCFTIDHNQRALIDTLLGLPFITRKQQTQAKLGFQQVKSISESIGSYKLEVEVMDVIPEKVQKMQRYSQNRINDSKINHQNPQSDFNAFSRKRSSSVYNQQQNSQKEFKHSFIRKTNKGQSKEVKYHRLKTQNFIKQAINQNSGQQFDNSINAIEKIVKKQHRQLRTLKTEDSQVNIERPYRKGNNKTVNFRINTSKSKSKITQNQITLNNMPLANEHTSSKYWPTPGVGTPYNSEQTCSKINDIIREIQQEGGEKYFKKPLKLLKRKLNIKKTLKTQASMTYEDSYGTQEALDLEEVNLENIDNTESNLFSIEGSARFPTEFSRISQQTHEQEVIQTAVSKAQKNRYETEQKMLRRQRQAEKNKWQTELKQGHQFIKKQLDSRYYRSQSHKIDFK